MKYQSLFSGIYKERKLKMSFAENFTQHAEHLIPHHMQYWSSDLGILGSHIEQAPLSRDLTQN